MYCYELYHQSRCRWPRRSRFVLNREVDKRGQPLELMCERFQSPDFLVHRPGDMRGNHLIMEVKSADGRPAGIRKDLETLQKFRHVAGYARGILLIYGEGRGVGAHAIGV